MRVILVMALSAISVACTDDGRRPNPAAMMQYKLSQVSDEQIRSMAPQAEIEARQINYLAMKETAPNLSARVAQYEKDRAKVDAHNSAVAMRCRDIVTATRDPEGCALQEYPPDPRYDGVALPPATASAVIRANIYGACGQATTVREARTMGCLPPG